MGGHAKRELLIQVRMSSSAKADDPVRRAVWVRSQAGDYWIPAFAGMTAVPGAFRAAKYPGPDAPICLLRFRAADRMLAHNRRKKSEGARTDVRLAIHVRQRSQRKRRDL